MLLLSNCKVRTGTSRVQLFHSFATLTLEINMLGSNVLTVDEADNTIKNIARSKTRKLNPLSIIPEVCLMTDLMWSLSEQL